MLSHLQSSLAGQLVRIGEIIPATDMCTLFRNPIVIVLMLIVCVVLATHKKYKLLAAFVSVPALFVLTEKTAQNLTFPGCYTKELPVFVGALLAIAAINVYLYLIRD